MQSSIDTLFSDLEATLEEAVKLGSGGESWRHRSSWEMGEVLMSGGTCGPRADGEARAVGAGRCGGQASTGGR